MQIAFSLINFTIFQPFSNSYVSFKQQYSNPVWIHIFGWYILYIATRIVTLLNVKCFNILLFREHSWTNMLLLIPFPHFPSRSYQQFPTWQTLKGFHFKLFKKRFSATIKVTFSGSDLSFLDLPLKVLRQLKCSHYKTNETLYILLKSKLLFS